MRVWRLAKAAYMTPNGEGAKKYGGRWNPPGLAVVYTSESLALAAFEALVHADSDLLPDDLVIQSADIPDRLAIRTISPDELPDNWQTIPAPPTLQTIGTDWVRTNQKVGLRLPSSVIPQAWNILLNPAHPEFSAIKWINEGPFHWDLRMRRECKGRGERGRGKGIKGGTGVQGYRGTGIRVEAELGMMNGECGIVGVGRGSRGRRSGVKAEGRVSRADFTRTAADASEVLASTG